jgi:hypothetical protein
MRSVFFVAKNTHPTISRRSRTRLALAFPLTVLMALAFATRGGFPLTFGGVAFAAVTGLAGASLAAFAAAAISCLLNPMPDLPAHGSNLCAIARRGTEAVRTGGEMP